MSLIPVNPIIEYCDYRKFTNFIENKYQLSVKNINPYEFFRVDMCFDNPDHDKMKFASGMFCGRSVTIPNFNISSNSFNHYSRFEDFTSRDEVRNLSLWSISCLKNLSFDKNVRLGKELEIIQNNNPRDGRLDVVALCDEQFLVFEVKVGLSSLLKEGRYKYQIPAYVKECVNLIKNDNYQNENNQRIDVILLIGGEETDVYPSEHPDCTTGQVGNISKIFYDSVKEYGFKFLTANALWSITAYSEIMYTKIYWTKIITELLSDDQNIGLVSGGVVRREGDLVKVVPITL